MIEIQLDDKRVHMKRERESEGQDAHSMKKMQQELASKLSLQSLFARGVKKMFIQWVMCVMETRLQQTKALSHLSTITGKNEVSSFQQWRQRSDELAKVRHAMAPFAGRKDKMLVKELFRAWRQEVADDIQDRKDVETLGENFRAWKQRCVKSIHMKKAKEILSFLVQGGSASANFYAWWDIIYDRKDREVEILTNACIKVQRRYKDQVGPHPRALNREH